MSEHGPSDRDPFVELRFALAEGDAVEPSGALRDHVLSAAAAARAAGRAVDAGAWISGAEAFRRTIERLDALLSELDAAAWAAPALRGLDVQGLVGHLIGVEELFGLAVVGDDDAGRSDHIEATQGAALRQAGAPFTATHREWFDRATGSIAAISTLDPAAPATFYGVTMPLDDLLVIRAFEMWIHDEDIRRATGRPLAAPDAERLARMTAIAATLLPAGITRAGVSSPGSVRLVLTGSGGGTWDVALGLPAPQQDAGSTLNRVVVDATAFCRVVANRADQASVAPVVHGDADVAAAVFAGAAALALD